jgi:hypothetical protein
MTMTRVSTRKLDVLLADDWKRFEQVVHLRITTCVTTIRNDCCTVLDHGDNVVSRERTDGRFLSALIHGLGV